MGTDGRASGAGVYLRTLGQLGLFGADRTDQALLANAKPLIVLAYLATKPNLTATREHLAELLWPEADGAGARRSLRQALFQLAKRAGAPVVLTDAVNGSVTLNRELVTVDLWEFDTAIEEDRCERAVELYRGPFLAGLERAAGVEVDQWIETQNSRVLVGLEVAYTKLVSQSLASGDHSAAVRYAREYAQLNPLNDVAQITLVRALKAAGEEIAALRAYQAYRTLLKEVFEDQPPADLQETMEGVRRELLRKSESVAALAGPRAPGPALELDRRARAWRLAALSSAGLAALLLLVTLLSWLLRPSLRSGERLGQLSATLVVVVGEGRAELGELRIDGSDATLRPYGRAPSERVDPGGSLVAGVDRGPDGWNLTIARVDGSERRVVTATPGDEEPQTWSPDGRYLLFSHRRLVGETQTPVYRLMLYDPSGGAQRPFTDLQSGSPMTPAWSPDGTRVAFTAEVDGNTEVFVADADGEAVNNVSNHRAADGDPAWSPDGRELAFVSRRTGTAQLFGVRSDGDALRAIAETEGEVATPAWVSANAVAFVQDRGGVRDLWVAHVPAGTVERLTRGGEIRGVLTRLRGPRAPSWIDAVRLHPRHALVSPGQLVRFDPMVTDDRGERLALALDEVRWTVIGSEIAQVVEPGLVRVAATGTAWLVASVRGWRADTLALRSVPIVETGVERVFADDWRRGLRTAEWAVYGDPPPYVRSDGGWNGAGFLVNNGDAHFESGVVSTRSFRIDTGLTVEVLGRMPFTRSPFQRFAVALLPEEPPSSGDWLDAVPIVELTADDSTGQDRVEIRIATEGREVRIPLPERSSAWHRYTLQVHPDGTLDLIVDGRFRWRSVWRQAVGPRTTVRLGLGGQSRESEIAHGPVSVFAGLRYRMGAYRPQAESLPDVTHP